jgi:hypothetical protein
MSSALALNRDGNSPRIDEIELQGFTVSNDTANHHTTLVNSHCEARIHRYIFIDIT